MRERHHHEDITVLSLRRVQILYSIDNRQFGFTSIKKQLLAWLTFFIILSNNFLFNVLPLLLNFGIKKAFIFADFKSS